MVLGFLVAVIKKRKSAIDGEVDEDDFDESDEEMIHAWFTSKLKTWWNTLSSEMKKLFMHNLFWGE